MSRELRSKLQSRSLERPSTRAESGRAATAVGVLRDTVVARPRPRVATEPVDGEGWFDDEAATPRALEPEDDDVIYYAAVTKRRRIKNALIALGVVLGLWGLKVLVSGGGHETAEVAIPSPVVERPHAQVVAPPPVVAPPAPPVVPAVEPAPEPEPKPVKSSSAKSPKQPATTTRYFAAPPAKRAAPTVVADEPKVDGYEGEVADDAPPRARPSALLWSEPGGAAVTVNGRYVGRTPLNVSWDLGTTTEIEVSLGGYDTAQLQLTPDSGSGILKVQLQRSVDEPEPEPEPEPEEAKTPERVDLRTAFPDAERRAPSDDAMPEPTRR